MELLLATVLFSSYPDEFQLSCEDGYWILDGIAATDLTVAQRSGLLSEVMLAMPNDCDVSDFVEKVRAEGTGNSDHPSGLKEKNSPIFSGATYEHSKSHQEADQQSCCSSRRSDRSHRLPWCNL